MRRKTNEMAIVKIRGKVEALDCFYVGPCLLTFSEALGANIFWHAGFIYNFQNVPGIILIKTFILILKIYSKSQPTELLFILTELRQRVELF